MAQLTHEARARGKANDRRRLLAEAKQRPLPLAEQQHRFAARAAEKQKRYPVPPTYSDSWGRKPRAQPACYDLGLGDPFTSFLAQLAFQTMRRASRAPRAA